MIQANVHHHAVKPGRKRGLKTEPREGAIDFQKGLLVKIGGLFRGTHYLEGKAQHLAIVPPHEHVESSTVPTLSAPNERSLIRPRRRRGVGGDFAGQFQASAIHFEVNADLTSSFCSQSS